MGWKKKKKQKKTTTTTFFFARAAEDSDSQSSSITLLMFPPLRFFPPPAAPAFFVFFLNLHITRCDTLATILQNNTVVAFESREKIIIRCVDGGHSQAGSKIKTSPRLVYVKKRRVTFWTTPPYDFHSSRSTPTFTLSACPLPRSPLSHLPEKRRGGWELPR